MNLEIISIEGSGDLERERVVCRATKDADVGNYAVFMGRAAEDDGRFLSGAVPSAFWFADKEIKAGDLVVLYTKRGKTSSKTNEKGRTSYFYYWGKDTPQWSENTVAALVETSDWETKNVPPVIEDP